ncbi:DcrB-related protein [Dermatobacter hominis]|uniref:DcrB-related protein n=1 Tax=Dermatobacter hominis TaxID=2884263 RepID=UPI001D106FF6|nr:DcrB-related protein [Dermatobacter hominis]UDY34998.1 DUF1795 domain-containing protein [Dermatobacter hominis]
MSEQRYQGTIGVTVPAGWFVKESITLLAPSGQANVIVSSEPLDPTITTAQYAATQGELLRREFPGYVEHRVDETGVFGMDGYLRQFEWTPPDGVRVAQVQAYATREGRGYTATGTAPATVAGEHIRTFLDVLRSVEVDGPTRPSGAGSGAGPRRGPQRSVTWTG